MLGCAVALASCGDVSPVPQAATVHDSATCPQVGVDAWGALEGVLLHETRGGLEPELGAVAGLAVYRDSVYVFDTSEPGIVVFDSALNRIRRFGRRGRGPGELEVDVITSRPALDHLVVDERAIIVGDRDGQSLKWYGQDGRYDRSATVPVILNKRLRIHGDTVFAELPPFGRDASAPDSFAVVMSIDGELEPVFTILKQIYPRTPSGSVMVGRDEARPKWDVQGRCLVLNDGHHPTILYHDRSTGATDSISFEMPEYAFPEADVQEFPRGIRMPPYERLGRFRDLVIDPSGAVWLDINAVDATDSHFVARVMPDGSVAFDTLPTFPRAFASNGRIYGVKITSQQGEVQVQAVK